MPLRPRATLAERFHARHRERFGFADPDAEIEVMSVRTSRGRGRPGGSSSPAPRGRRAVRGPASVALDGATLWVADGVDGAAAAATAHGG